VVAIGRHPIYMSEQPALLIDIRNALYRAIYAVRADRRNTLKYHYFTVLLRQMNTWINYYKPESIHIFWDAPRKTVWRRKILPTYKDRTNNQYIEDISEDLFKTTNICKAFFNHMNVRQYSKKTMEADDLIFAAVAVMHPKPTVVISSDSDMIQIPYMFSSSKVFDPGKQIEPELPTVNPVIQKCLVGDKSDNIPGYRGIGPKKSQAMLEDTSLLVKHLADAGNKTLMRNMLLVDLSLNPRLMINKFYVQRKVLDPVEFDSNQIKHLMNKYKISGLMQNYNNLVLPFQKLS
jgi:5'-3' exonuclease